MYTIAKDTMHIIQIKKLIKTELRMGSGTQVPKIETRFVFQAEMKIKDGDVVKDEDGAEDEDEDEDDQDVEQR